MDSLILVQMIENLLNSIAGTFEYKIYDVLKMDDVKVDTKKVNGVAEIVSGVFEPVKGLNGSSVEMSIDFVFPVERLEEVKRVFTEASKQSVGLIVSNSSIDSSLFGSTELLLAYPSQGVYNADTMGENITSQLIAYFDINEKAIFSNEVTIDIENERYEKNEKVTDETVGNYYKKVNSEYVSVVLPDEYEENTEYYEKVIFWENIPYHKQVITRTINNNTNNYANETERLIINDGQALNISLLVTSRRGSIINKIKKDKLMGQNIMRGYKLRLTDDDGSFIFNNMVVSGDFVYNLEPRNLAFFQLTFVCGRIKNAT